MKKRTVITTSVIVLVCAILTVIVICFISGQKNKEVFEAIGDSHYYAYQVEDVSIDGDDVVIKGWFFSLKRIRNTEYENDPDDKPGVIIYDISRETENYSDGSGRKRTGISADVTRINRPDINDYFKCEYDYSYSGFEARVKKSEINLENGKYQVIIKPEETGLRGIQAAYLVNGKVKYTNPLDDIELNVAGTDLEEIVDNGTCVVSFPSQHVCVYQYGWKLYWIVDKDFFFEVYGGTHIQYQAETTQFNRLPATRTNIAKYWDDMEAAFENYEITDTMNCGEYRVMVRDLPTAYSITQMSTGYCDFDTWLWRRFFRPDYRLRNN